MDIGSLLFSFNGRINRGKYWLAVLIYFLVSLAIGVLGYVMGHDVLFQVINAGVSLVIFISGIAVGIKRLHDRDKSGWWLLLYYVFPTLLAVIGAVFQMMTAGVEGENYLVFIVFLVAAIAIVIWAFIDLGCLRGTAGPNRFGPDPLQPAYEGGRG